MEDLTPDESDLWMQLAEEVADPGFLVRYRALKAELEALKAPKPADGPGAYKKPDGVR